MSIADLIAARDDTDLRERVRAAAEARGLGSGWADSQMGRLVAAQITSADQTTTIADVLAYARATYTPTPRPGQNPAAVMDDMIYAAIEAINKGV